MTMPLAVSFSDEDYCPRFLAVQYSGLVRFDFQRFEIYFIIINS